MRYQADHGGSEATAHEGSPGEGGPPVVDRRRFLRRAAVGGAVAWVAPTIASRPAAAGPGTALGGSFVAVGRTGNVVPASFVTSDSGASWPTSANPYADGALNGVATDGSAVVTVGIDEDGQPTSGVSRTSFDGGLTWSIAATPVETNGDLRAVATNGTGTWVAVGSRGTTGATVTSTDAGVSWPTSATLAVGTFLDSVAHGSGTWIAGGADYGADDAIVVRSTNAGASWGSPITVHTEGVVRGLATDGAGRWVAVTSPLLLTTGGPSHVWVSADDGATWSGPTLTVAGDLHGVATDGSTWVAVGQVDARATVWRSTNDGLNWSSGTQLAGYTSEAWGVATDGDGTWVAVGYGRPSGTNNRPASFTSDDDGLTWPTVTVIPTVGILYAVVPT